MEIIGRAAGTTEIGDKEMTNTSTAAQVGGMTGQKFLYEKPELLTKEVHSSMGFSVMERPYEFVRNVRAVPLTMVEFGSAQRTYPIIFSNMENPVPLAVHGIIDDENLFVDEDGKWDEMSYVPMYLRCHPFAFASGDGDRMAVVVDTAAATVSDNPQFPFFVDGEISEQAGALMKACVQYEAERKRTQEFCDRVKELGLLAPLRATHTPEGASEPEPLANYIAINAEKLNDLPADVIFELHTKGFLSAMYLQLYSLENWRHLMARRVVKIRQTTG